MANEERALSRLRTQLADDQRCLELLLDLRWPEGGVKCLRCGKVVDRGWIRGYRKTTIGRTYYCARCGRHFSATTGTIFHRSRLPLTVWFEVLWKFAESFQRVPLKWMVKRFHVTYRTAHRVLDSLRRGTRDQLLLDLLKKIKYHARKRRRSRKSASGLGDPSPKHGS